MGINLTYFGTEKYDCVKKQSEIFTFLHLINKSFKICCAFLSDITEKSCHQKLLKLFFFSICYSLKCLTKYHP